MTTYGHGTVTCALCKTTGKQPSLTSTNSFGSRDLDLRPPEMMRSTMPVWLQECPNCGFVAANLAEAEAGVQEIVSTERFMSLNRGALSGTLTSRFLKRSLLDEELGKISEAAEHALWAAWAADDAHDESAAEYRSKAADLFLVAAADLPSDSDVSRTMRTRVVDVLRRARRFDEAVALADVLLATDDLDPTIRCVLAYERDLAQSGEHAVRTVEHALMPKRPNALMAEDPNPFE